jgi:hypothetical protein
VAPHEIQFGILKRLRGTPIIRHTDAFQLRFNPEAPYNILSTDRIDFLTLQRMNRFARYWDLIANSGRFAHSLPVLLADSAFANFMTFSDWLFQQTKSQHGVALDKLYALLESYLLQKDGSAVSVQLDRERQRGLAKQSAAGVSSNTSTPQRQRRHLRAEVTLPA